MELQTKYETDKKEKEIALLNKDKLLSEIQIKKHASSGQTHVRKVSV